MTRAVLGALLAATVVVAPACVPPPVYHRPAVDPPAAFRGDAPPPGDQPASSLGDAKWFEVFQDEGLQALVRTALERSYDVQLAAARIVEAQAQLGITRADQFPTVAVGPSVIGQRTSAALGFPARTVGAIQVEARAAWEADFWRRYRNATDAARARLVATEWGQRAVLSRVVSQVADAYFTLRALDAQLDIATRALVSRQESLRITQVREQGGVTSLVDVRQAEQLVYGATSEIARLRRAIEQQENFISVILGANPGPVTRGRALNEQPQPPDVPAGLSSALLERRADIQQAEQELVALNAEIAVARANYFPRIPLTGSAGAQSAALAGLFSTGGAIWSAGVSALTPVFTAGRTRSQVALATARADEAAVGYQQTVKTAFREVSDALVGYRQAREFREQEALLLASAQDARRLAQIRYEGGATSYLEVLDAETRLFVAELGAAQAQLEELRGLVDIYQALGGGWM